MRAVSLITVLLLIGTPVFLTSAHGDDTAVPPSETKAQVPVAVPIPPVRARHPAPAVRETRVYRLSNSAAGKVAEAMELFLQVKYHVDGTREEGDAAPWTIVAEKVSNSILASAEPPIQGEIERLIRELDAPRTQIEIQAKISVTGLDGKADIHSEPRIMTLNGQRATVVIERSDGTKLQVELTPRVVEPTKSE